MWQHFPRPEKITDESIGISYFNNFNTPTISDTHPSIGLVLQFAIPPNKSTPPVVIDYLSDSNDAIYSGTQGSASLLANGNFLVAYGENPVLKEYGPGGTTCNRVFWTARFGSNDVVQSYRGYKAQWHGFPATRPSLAVEEDDSGCRLGYVSWNGATDVKEWVVYEGWTMNRLSRVGRIGYKGFGTRFSFGRPCAQVAALFRGRSQVRSNVVCVHRNQITHNRVVLFLPRGER